MSRRDVRAGERSDYAVAPPSRCAKVLYYTWKLCSVLFSHLVMISLVVAYCILGAVTFEKLEAEHEKEVKNNISQIRSNTTLSIWSMTRAAPLLNHTSWTEEVVHMLKDFESSILHEMKMRGWDGNESTDHIQWTFTGALFYSIIVITTIGYGHIAPKTQTGKVVTIFYAILGIPLMLLCLSNIGDVMATSFRFLYWRVCCYVCTRPPKRRRRHHAAGAARRSVRGRYSSTRRKRPALERAHSDTDFRYRDSGYSSGRARRARPAPRAPSPRAPRTRSQPPPHVIGSEDIREDRSPARYDWAASHRTPLDNEEYYPKASLPLQDLAAALKDLDDHSKKVLKNESRSKSVPRPAKQHSDYGPRKDWDDTEYDLGERDKNMFVMHDLHDVDYENFREKKALEERSRRMREKNGEPEGYRDRGYDPEDDDFEFDSPRHRRNFTLDNRRKDRGRSEFYERDRDDNDYSRRYQHERRAKSAAVYEYGQRWVDDHERERDRWPDAEGGKGRRLRRLQTVDDSYRYENRYSPSPPREDWSDDELPPTRRSRPSAWDSRQLEMYPALPEPSPKEEIKPVPIWLCVLLVGSYIVAGTFLFKRWESWAYLDSAYFCFITLTTIGFGDFVPAQGQSGDPASAVHSIALCSLYLLFGIALLAMSFNLVQEEVRANVAALATSLGIIKPQRTGSETDDDY